MRDVFTSFAARAAQMMGNAWAFILATLVVIGWAMSGPMFGFSDTWQLVINTGTTIITFLMVFLIQNTQNRDARAMHLKLDELIAAVRNARNEMIDIEKLSDEELEKIAKRYEKIREACEDPGHIRRVAEQAVDKAADRAAEETVKRIA
ncbi:MAG TPA: low affinity iron permease family protein [Blastocatellia bacterium]|nr:low affinity iron permease family protein [Blastocatellia bacterium]